MVETEDVAGLEISMEHTGAVRGAESAQQIPAEISRLCRRERTPPEQLSERLPFQIVAHIIPETTGLAGLMDAHHARMIQAGQNTGFTEEAAGDRIGRELGV
jgi:hypothetical protein